MKYLFISFEPTRSTRTYLLDQKYRNKIIRINAYYEIIIFQNL